MNINNFINDDTFLQDFQAFTTAVRPVEVKWGGTGIHTITGPNPLVDISTSFNSTEGGVVESIVHTITLTGKIFKVVSPFTLPPNTDGVIGFTNVVNGITALEKFFNACSVGNLEVFCNAPGGNPAVPLYSLSGVKVKGISFSKTPDNWTQSADYTVELEHKIAADPSGDNGGVEERSESWSIEPMDEAIYSKFTLSVAQQSENINPKMLPVPPSPNSPQPPLAVGGGQFSGPGALQIFNIPQFRISRRLSAKGITPPPSATMGLCPPSGEIQKIEKLTFLQAKKWVDKQSSIAFNGATATGSIVLANNPQPLPIPTGLWLYNHSRTVSADIYNGTYEANDTWLAMPTGILYIETFSTDYSTDDTGSVTVRVNGSVQGLQLTPDYVTGNNQTPTTNNGPFLDPVPSAPGAAGGNIYVDLNYAAKDSPSVSINYNVPGLAITAPSHNKQIKSAKYLNALDGWINDIKPYIYRRASMVMNSNERQQPPPQLASTNPPPPQSNFIYIKEGLLNVIPTSTSEGHDPIKGIITYSHEFNNKNRVISGVLSENIRITNTAPATNVQETQILGRALGPVLYSAGVTNPRKSVSIDITVPKPTGLKGILQTETDCPLYVSGYYWTTIDRLIYGLAPFSNRSTIDLFMKYPPPAKSQTFGTFFKDSDSEDWNPTEGRYSRTVSWIYQQCTVDKFYMDH